MDANARAEEQLAQLHARIETGRYDALFTDTPASPELDALADDLAQLTAKAMPHLEDIDRARAWRHIAVGLRGDGAPTRCDRGARQGRLSRWFQRCR